MARTLGVERTLFFGTSGGGFAALVQSHAMPGSVAVVVNPQTSILRYHPTLVEPYRQACWPALAGNEGLAGAIEADCTRLYGEGFRNTVIYIQSLGDRHHYRAHMLPFAAAISARAQADRVLFHTRYNGVHGHSQSREDYADWLRAAALSPSTAPLDLLDTWHGLNAPARTQNAQAQNAQAQSPQPRARLLPPQRRHAPRRHPDQRPARKLAGAAIRPHPRTEGRLMINPYRGRPTRAFWKAAVAQRHLADIDELWAPMALTPADRIATAGSCFAQHIGQALARRGAHFLDCEPPPPIFADTEEARRFGYRVFSCRYGNVYTARQMRQLAEEALGLRPGCETVWEREGRFYDALRPGVDPVGQASVQAVRHARRLHLAAVRTMLETLDVMVFTLGLTECWEDLADGTVYPVAPGTLAGSFDPQAHAFRNLRHGEVLADMEAFWALLRQVNPGARMLLTVSPVPLMATATRASDHTGGMSCPPRSIPSRCCARWRVIWPMPMPISPISRPTRSSPAIRRAGCSSTPTCAR
jgi:hypothetical protein